MTISKLNQLKTDNQSTIEISWLKNDSISMPIFYLLRHGPVEIVQPKNFTKLMGNKANDLNIPNSFPKNVWLIKKNSSTMVKIMPVSVFVLLIYGKFKFLKKLLVANCYF